MWSKSVSAIFVVLLVVGACQQAVEPVAGESCVSCTTTLVPISADSPNEWNTNPSGGDRVVILRQDPNQTGASDDGIWTTIVGAKDRYGFSGFTGPANSTITGITVRVYGANQTGSTTCRYFINSVEQDSEAKSFNVLGELYDFEFTGLSLTPAQVATFQIEFECSSSVATVYAMRAIVTSSYSAPGTEKSYSGVTQAVETRTLGALSATEKTLTPLEVAWGNGYSYRTTLTVDNTKVSGSTDFTNYVMLFSGTYSYLADTSNGGQVTDSNGYDIIFTSDEDGVVQLDHEIQAYDNTTGECIFWVRIPTLDADADTAIYVWYGNSSVTTSQESVAGTWPSDHLAVLHLQESGNGTADEYADSSGNAYHGQGGTGSQSPPNRVSGAPNLGFAQDCSGTNEYIRIATGTGLNVDDTDRVTLSAWVKGDTTPNNGPIEQFVNKQGAFALAWDHTTAALDTGMFVKATTGWKNSNDAVVSAGTWYHFVGTYDGADVSAYLNGTRATFVNAGTFNIATSADVVGIGATGTPSSFFDGKVSHVRILNSALSADYIATEYNNQSSPATFYSIAEGAQQVAQDTKTLTASTGTEKVLVDLGHSEKCL